MNTELQTRQVLIVEDVLSGENQALHGALDRLAQALTDRNIAVHFAAGVCEAYPLAATNMDLDAFLVATDMAYSGEGDRPAIDLLRHIRERQAGVPVFLLADRSGTSRHLDESLMELANEFVWIFEDSPVFIAGRVEAAICRWRSNLLPPLMQAIWDYNESHHEYSWAAPGHQGGVGFTKSPEGKKFYDFYGENLFRTDTGIERGSIGSLLDHEGAFEKSEAMAAKVFGTDRSYSVVVGTSGSNRTVIQAVLTDADVAVCDRNCHKSIEQGLIMTGASPVYMIPTRNRYGIIGPIHRSEMTPDAIRAKIAASPIAPKGAKPAYAVVTNCTYDGLCYNSEKVESELAQSVDAIHMDEAWYGYARFNPIYADHFAMRGAPPESRTGPTVFATHSTHKLLNALSQASYIHVREGRRPVPFERFNQSYMLHATTSPLYAICASNDVAAAMMGRCGRSLTREVIEEAVDFRQALARICTEAEQDHDWFFKPWNAPTVTDRKTGRSYAFAEAPRELLVTDQRCWRIENGDSWHGFADLEENWVMLDPIKVSILTPGMGDDGTVLDRGVPAALVSYYLYREGIVPTRTTDFQIMFLFSMGITKGKWGTLLNTLLNFKRMYRANAPVADVFPDLAAAWPDRYGKDGVRTLSDRMFRYIREKTPEAMLDRAFRELPHQVLTPREAYRHIVTGHVEQVPSTALAGRVAACSVIPYPPGIPMLMSGEAFGGDDCPQIQYLKQLEFWDAEFPGFEHVTEGAESVDGVYHVMCVKP
ncbi:MAG: arginine decarboxylase [Lentisphaeria bacterium]|nr:arginine decarboxylase [Lentisphaeria bacterium]